MIDYKMDDKLHPLCDPRDLYRRRALTPPDMISQFLLAIPLLLLYALSVGVAYAFRLKPEDAPAAAISKQPDTL